MNWRAPNDERTFAKAQVRKRRVLPARLGAIACALLMVATTLVGCGEADTDDEIRVDRSTLEDCELLLEHLEDQDLNQAEYEVVVAAYDECRERDELPANSAGDFIVPNACVPLMELLLQGGMNAAQFEATRYAVEDCIAQHSGTIPGPCDDGSDECEPDPRPCDDGSDECEPDPRPCEDGSQDCDNDYPGLPGPCEDGSDECDDDNGNGSSNNTVDCQIFYTIVEDYIGQVDPSDELLDIYYTLDDHCRESADDEAPSLQCSDLWAIADQYGPDYGNDSMVVEFWYDLLSFCSDDNTDPSTCYPDDEDCDGNGDTCYADDEDCDDNSNTDPSTCYPDDEDCDGNSNTDPSTCYPDDDDCDPDNQLPICEEADDDEDCI